VNGARRGGAHRTGTLAPEVRDTATPPNGTPPTGTNGTPPNGTPTNGVPPNGPNGANRTPPSGALPTDTNGTPPNSTNSAPPNSTNSAPPNSTNGAPTSAANGANGTPTNGTLSNGTHPDTRNGSNGAYNGANGARTDTTDTTAFAPDAYVDGAHNDNMDVDAASHGTAPGNVANGGGPFAGASARPPTGVNGVYATNGHAGNGHAADGHAADGQVANWQASNGQASNGHVGTGHVGNGHVGMEQGVSAQSFINGTHGRPEPVTFGFGETAGVLPGDQRTFDDVEAGIVALWRRFGERREQPLRDRLVLHYAPLVKYVAGRVGTGLPAHVEVADLIQSGIFGLVDAIEKFEPERGLKFETYAMQRIRGAILDDLRAQDWVPRSVRGRAREVERALERLGAQLRRTPTDSELADALGLSLHELRDVYAQLQLTSVVALDELAAAGRGPTPLADILEDQEALDPVALLVDQDNRRQLAQAIAHLAERDRVVVTLYYFENLTLAEIGRVLGVTESRVCQLHTRAVLRLRAKLLEKSEA
jgi:RNA polymerase sigma factor FliA